MSNRKGSGFISGLIAGSIVGALAAFLFSQKSDKDTIRGKLGDLIGKGRESIREAIQDGKETETDKSISLCLRIGTIA